MTEPGREPEERGTESIGPAVGSASASHPTPDESRLGEPAPSNAPRGDPPRDASLHDDVRREQRRKARLAKLRAARSKTVGLLASLAMLVAVVIAVILALHIVFVIFPTNPDNPFVEFVRDWGRTLVVFFHNLFTPNDPRVRVLVNYGLAAIFWLIIGRIVAALIRRLG